MGLTKKDKQRVLIAVASHADKYAVEGYTEDYGLAVNHMRLVTTYRDLHNKLKLMWKL